MHNRLRSTAGTLALVCTALTAAGSISAAAPRPGVRLLAGHAPLPPAEAAAAGAVPSISVTFPPGCSFNGPSYFLATTGTSLFPNHAGGGSGANHDFASVLAGDGNQACDGWSSIAGGTVNTIGGDGTAYYSAISSGVGNTIDHSPGGFIGAGEFNQIGLAGPYPNPYNSAVGSGSFNKVSSPQSFIGAGYKNTIVSLLNETNGQSAVIGSGQNNTVSGNFAGILTGQANLVSADNSAIVAGQNNTVSSRWGTISGGQLNTLSGQSAAIGGGLGNVAAGFYASVGGGYHDNASGEYAAVAGGASNSATGPAAAIAGGFENAATANNAAVPGGYLNVAGGIDSFAAGTSSHALHSGTFVWSDNASGAHVVASTAANQFLARASGGYKLYSAANLSTGVQLAPGSGSWSSVSDRAAKTAIASVDDARILATVAALPVSEWSYTAQGTGVRHLGPMAQDFRAAFGLGEDEKHIATVDEEGVALAAIKALAAQLAEQNREKDRELRALRRADDARFAALEVQVAALRAKGNL